MNFLLLQFFSLIYLYLFLCSFFSSRQFFSYIFINQYFIITIDANGQLTSRTLCSLSVSILLSSPTTPVFTLTVLHATSHESFPQPTPPSAQPESIADLLAFSQESCSTPDHANHTPQHNMKKVNLASKSPDNPPLTLEQHEPVNANRQQAYRLRDKRIARENRKRGQVLKAARPTFVPSPRNSSQQS